MRTAFDASVRAGVSFKEIYRWAEKGSVHFIFTARGAGLIRTLSLPLRQED